MIDVGLVYAFTQPPPALYPPVEEHGSFVLPWLYLKGVSTGDFGEALDALLGPGAPGLSPATLRRLKQVWHEELAQWQRRDLSGTRYVYC